MLTHAQIWTALDRLAAESGLSPSGLAKRAGLDPTTFNKSKRVTRDGRARWPSTESVAKALAATSTDIEAFVALLRDGSRRESGKAAALPVLGFAEAGGEGYVDDAGLAPGVAGKTAPCPPVGDPKAFALKITGESMRPVYRDGDVVVVSPAAPVRPGDRVVVKTRDGQVMIKELRRRTAEEVELAPVNTADADAVLPADKVAWIARILWVSQ